MPVRQTLVDGQGPRWLSRAFEARRSAVFGFLAIGRAFGAARSVEPELGGVDVPAGARGRVRSRLGGGKTRVHGRSAAEHDERGERRELA